MCPYVKYLPPAVFFSILKVLNFIFSHGWEALMLSQKDWPKNRFLQLQLNSGDTTKSKAFHHTCFDKYLPCAWECPGDVSAQFFSREVWPGILPLCGVILSFLSLLRVMWANRTEWSWLTRSYFHPFWRTDCLGANQCNEFGVHI